ncbi:MAPEG family protein [Aliihoeflea sp. PC F10.4]
MDSTLSVELVILGLSVVLLVVHTAIQGQMATRERGIDWNIGPRDGMAAPLGERAGRAQRALDNFKETWPAFIALSLGLAVTGSTGGIGAIGAVVWFVARIVYLPLYLYGVPRWRSMTYLVSMIGLLLMLIRFFF